MLHIKMKVICMKLNNRHLSDFSVAMLTEGIFTTDNVRRSASHEDRLYFYTDKTEKSFLGKSTDTDCEKK